MFLQLILVIDFYALQVLLITVINFENFFGTSRQQLELTKKTCSLLHVDQKVKN